MLALGLCPLLGTTGLAAGRNPSKTSAPPAASAEIGRDAYRGAIVIDAATGQVLFEDKADVQNPPASVLKLMTFLIVQDKIRQGELALNTPVTIPAQAAKMGGSEAWLVHKEVVPVEELLYLLMVQSANDAAMALAIQTTGSKEAFVDVMNTRARALGMTHTEYHSPHGLPPGRGQEPDLSTARDLALLCRELITKTDILRYTSTRSHEFRHANGVVNKFENHDRLLGTLPGCDGLKTGWYAKAGYSIALTVQRNGRRIIVVVLGSPQRELRDNVATRLVERGFAALPAAAATPPAAPSGDGASSLKLVPLKPEEKQSLENGPDSSPAVHVDLSGKKK
jgi:D-alanyl-D-alanine carboxypeptidase (penicillin-binding protein 5/6)